LGNNPKYGYFYVILQLDTNKVSEATRAKRRWKKMAYNENEV
jgi:hypothetical protein